MLLYTSSLFFLPLQNTRHACRLLLARPLTASSVRSSRLPKPIACLLSSRTDNMSSVDRARSAEPPTETRETRAEYGKEALFLMFWLSYFFIPTFLVRWLICTMILQGEAPAAVRDLPNQGRQ